MSSDDNKRAERGLKIEQDFEVAEPASAKHRSQFTGHCFTNTESILNIHKS